MKNKIIKQFVELLKIPSSSGNENLIREYLIKKLLPCGWTTYVDETGNLIVYKNKNAKLWLVAHMDTVLKAGEAVKPVINENIITSDGTTILGADNKAGVFVLLFLATKDKLLDECGLIFSVNEEMGEMGTSKINWNEFSPKLVLNIDGSDKVGVVNHSGMGQIVFETEIWGKAAHAAKNPEDGINAIEVATKIIVKIKQGKDDRNNTCNIGSIVGGGATNVVSDYVKFTGEIRSPSKRELANKWKKLLEIINTTSKQYGTQSKVINKQSDGVPVWEKSNKNKYKDIFKKAADITDVKLSFEPMFACSDANFLSNVAEVYSINCGGHLPHSHQEWINVDDILFAKLFVSSIVSSFNMLFKI